MPENEVVIRLEDVSKVYTLYPNPWETALDVLNLRRFFFWKARMPHPEFQALKDVSLTVRRGERLGIVGRNGAGKTTLLKLLTHNFSPTTGTVEVNGKVQSLMETGIGFHNEFTGYENIRASLIYNGLETKQLQRALEEIIDFVELGDYLHQPIKTYSLGMSARLGFATATAIRPDILMIDEVLSAGDAYFSLKCAERMKRLTHDGVTLLMVSHSTQQILQFCQRAVWLENGRIVQQGDALTVVKAYDGFIRTLDEERLEKENRKRVELHGKTEVIVPEPEPEPVVVAAAEAQEAEPEIESLVEVSRWNGTGELQIVEVAIFDESRRKSSVLKIGRPVSLEITLKACVSGTFDCVYHFYLYTPDGTHVGLHLSEPETFTLQEGETRKVRLEYSSLLLGSGDYVLTAALYKSIDVNDVNNAVLYDLLDRSFQFKVYSDLKNDRTLVRLPATWRNAEGQTIQDVGTGELGAIQVPRPTYAGAPRPEPPPLSV